MVQLAIRCFNSSGGFKHSPDAIQWVKNDKSGFVFRIQLNNLSTDKNMQVNLSIYDATGNCVNSTGGTHIDLYSRNYLDVFWSGHNRRGRKVGQGVYKLIVTFKSGNKKERLYGNIGVRH